MTIMTRFFSATACSFMLRLIDFDFDKPDVMLNMLHFAEPLAVLLSL